MAEAPPAQAPALEEEDPATRFWSNEDLVLRAFVRAPFVTHGTLHAVNHRLKSLLRSDAFGKLRRELGLVEHGFVIAGGMRGGHTIAECRMLMWNGRWRPIPPMSGPRSLACSIIIDNEMWVMGGIGENDNLMYGTDESESDVDDLLVTRALATVEVYSPKTNSWRSCTPMRQPRIGAFAGFVGGSLVVAGGSGYLYEEGDGDRLTSAEVYTGNGWAPLPPMPHLAHLATACVLNGRLYVMGGYHDKKLQVLEMTEENGLSWSRKADLPANRHNAASVVHEGRIWVMGGYDGGLTGNHPSASVIIYDPETDAWETGPPLPFGCQCFNAAEIEGCIILYNGAGSVWGNLPEPIVYGDNGHHGRGWRSVQAGGTEDLLSQRLTEDIPSYLARLSHLAQRLTGDLLSERPSHLALALWMPGTAPSTSGVCGSLLLG